MKWRLEDLAFRYLEPEKYHDRSASWRTSGRARDYIAEVIDHLDERPRGRDRTPRSAAAPSTSTPSTARCRSTGRSFDELYDLLAIRVLVEDHLRLLRALGVVHNLWPPIPGQFDDYIAVPKGNVYRSLHTAVIGPGGTPLEVQIRTHEMHQVAEFGIAAHWRYKEGAGNDPQFEATLAWLRQLLPGSERPTAEEFVESVKTDCSKTRIFVFTPKGEVEAPRRAPRPWTSPTASTPTWATAASGRGSTASWCPWTTS